MAIKFSFSIFTPTYNRAHTILRVYNSLINQTYKNFEWIIVDDGSKDDTRYIIEKLIVNSPFSIKYIFKENEGKHIAINRALDIANGDLFLIFDSDDGCTNDTLEFFNNEWNKIQNLNQASSFSGMTVLCVNELGTPLSSEKYPQNEFDSNHLEMEFKYKLSTETWSCYSLPIIKQYKFPEFIKKSYVGESYIWRKIASSYKMRYFNKYLRVYYTDQEGITNSRFKRKSKLGPIFTSIDFFNNYEKYYHPFLKTYIMGMIFLALSSIEEKKWLNTFIKLKFFNLKMFYLIYTPLAIILKLYKLFKNATI